MKKIITNKKLLTSSLLACMAFLSAMNAQADGCDASDSNTVNLPACSQAAKNMQARENDRRLMIDKSKAQMNIIGTNAAATVNAGSDGSVSGATVNAGGQALTEAQKTQLMNASNAANVDFQNVTKAKEEARKMFSQLRSSLIEQYQQLIQEQEQISQEYASTSPSTAANAQQMAQRYRANLGEIQQATIENPSSVEQIKIGNDEKQQMLLHSQAYGEHETAATALQEEQQGYNQQIAKLGTQSQAYGEAANANQNNANSFSTDSGTMAAGGSAVAGAASASGGDSSGTSGSRGNSGMGTFSKDGSAAGGKALALNEAWDSGAGTAFKDAKGGSAGTDGKNSTNSNGGNGALTSGYGGGGSGLSSSSKSSSTGASSGSSDLQASLENRLNGKVKSGAGGNISDKASGDSAGNSLAGKSEADATAAGNLGNGSSMLGLAGSDTDASIKDMVGNMFASLMGGNEESSSNGSRGLASVGAAFDAQGRALAPNNKDIGNEEGTPLYARVRETIKRQLAKGNLVPTPKSKI